MGRIRYFFWGAALFLLVMLCAFVAVQLAHAAPDAALASIDQTAFIGQPIEDVEETLSSMNLPIARARYFAHADFLSHREPTERYFAEAYMMVETRQRAEAACEWECVFVLSERTDTFFVLFQPVVHRYLYLFVIENGVTVAIFNDSATWILPLYL